MRLSNNLENKIASDTHRRVQLICIEVQVKSSSEPQLEYYEGHTPLRNQGQLWPSGSQRNIMQLQIGSREESR